MRKILIILICILICLSLLIVCMDAKSSRDSSENSSGNVKVDTDEMGNTVFSLDNDIDYEFKDPENADNIEISPKE